MIETFLPFGVVQGYKSIMVKWLVTVVVLVVVLSLISQGLRCRVAGDFVVPVRGRVYYIPIASTLVLSLLVWLITKLISSPPGAPRRRASRSPCPSPSPRSRR